MRSACITDVDCALLYSMAGLAIGGTSVNGMLVVEATACRVYLKQLVAHGSVIPDGGYPDISLCEAFAVPACE